MEHFEEGISEVISIDFSCLNCDEVFVTSKARLYCSIRCRDDAKLIRYVRNAIKKGTFQQGDVQEAIDMKFAHASSEAGYYDSEARKLSPEKRAAVFERDNGLCRICNNPGSEVDHIDGKSGEMNNLQLLCYSCHIVKTKLNFKPLTPDQPRYQEIKERRKTLLSRIFASTPERLCYDPENWEELQPQMMAEQWQLLKQIKEDVEGKSLYSDLVEEERIKAELNQLAELESQLEILESQKQEQRDLILTPEIVVKLNDIENEFNDKRKTVNEAIQRAKDRIKERVGDYKNSIKGSDFLAVWRKGSVRWDSTGLEEYAKTHPEILQFRIEGKGSVAISQINKKGKK